MNNSTTVIMMDNVPVASNNIYYILFNASGVPGDFIFLICLRFVLGMIGFFLNMALFYVTVKTRVLFGTCNFLIGFNALCAIINTPFFGIGVVIVLANINFIPIWTCYWLQVVPMLFGNLYMVSMLAIGVDRLLCISFSFWHSKLNKFYYLTIMVLLCFAYSLTTIILCYQGVGNFAKSLVLCLNPGETYQGDIGDILFRMNLIAICLTIASYLLLWILLKCKRTALNGTFTQKIMKSLLCLLAVITLGYFTSSSTKVTAPYFTSNMTQIAYFTFITSLMSIIAKGLNAPILFVFSQDYRKAFYKQFPRIFPAYQNQVSSAWAVTKVQNHGNNHVRGTMYTNAVE